MSARCSFARLEAEDQLESGSSSCLVRTCADAILTGAGIGLAAATVIFLAAAIVARITPFH
jgi:hypothetical protein